MELNTDGATVHGGVAFVRRRHERFRSWLDIGLDSAIRPLDQPAILQGFGDILEKGEVSEGKPDG